MAAQLEEDSDLSLPEQFDAIFSLHQDLETTDESTASDRIQGRLRKGINFTESAIKKVNQLELFSRNEDIEEVSTNEIRYMMLSAYLGYFTGLNTHLPRIEAVTKSKVCYRDFLSLCNNYSVTSVRLEDASDDEDEESSKQVVAISNTARSQAGSINAMGGQRETKIQRFKEKKQLDSRLSELKSLVERDHVDDEVKREFYMIQLKRWANTAVDEMDSCNLELQMLAHREALKKSKDAGHSENTHQSNTPTSKPFRPFILTKNKLQKQVFGAGYPALPSMTVDEFYEQKVKEGTLSESVHGGQGGHSMQNWADDPEADERARDEEAAEKEKKEEEEDEETIMRARAMDDWKDDHRRGDGNRMNMG